MTGNQPNKPARPRLRLPFENRKTDAGAWTYDHRVGLCVVVIAYLMLAIAFVGTRIVVGRKPHEQGMLIDLNTLAELERERDRLEEEVRRKQQADPIDWSDVRNRVSNENSLNEALKDDRGTKASELNRAAQEIEAQMRANRQSYEEGISEADAIRNARDESDPDAKREDVREKGRVTVSFSLTDPLRTSRRLIIPAYRCEGGGEVVVAITVDRTGKVIDASVRSGGDACMRETAIGAARRSLFNIDDSAPARQTGTITYLFIPQ